MKNKEFNMEDTLKNMAEQAQSIYVIYKEQKEMLQSMQDIQGKMSEFGEKMARVEYKIDHRLTLDEAQMSEMTDLVRTRAIRIADYLNDIGYYNNKANFGQIVGAVMQGIRAMVKARFGVNRWFKIKELDYDNAMSYLEHLSITDFLAYRKKKVQIYKSKKANKPAV